MYKYINVSIILQNDQIKLFLHFTISVDILWGLKVILFICSFLYNYSSD